MIENTSGIWPCGHRLLILPENPEITTQSGIVIATGQQEKMEALAQTFGRVIAMGPTAYDDQTQEWCKVGDRVSFAKYSGLLNKGKDGKEYRVINDLDIVSICDKDVK